MRDSVDGDDVWVVSIDGTVFSSADEGTTWTSEA
jgi:photosystem II stability/assembly factor-like uncharacterized protein